MPTVAEEEFVGHKTARPDRKTLGLVSIFLLLWALSLLLQYAGNAYGSDLNVESDDPAHYVTGLMVHDYIRAGFPWPPAQFAENYYAHYPKVAIGHWPPFFYILQGAWMLVCGDSIRSDLVLMSLLNALLAATLFAVAWREFDSRMAALALAVLLLLIRVEQIFSGTIMADLPVALLCFWAVLLWSRYLEEGQPPTVKTRSMAGFALFASLAILTKGNGYALLLLPPVSLAIARRFDVLKDWRLWSFGALILAFCAPWSFVTRDLVTPTMQFKLTPGFVADALSYYSGSLARQASFGVALFALAGFVVVAVRWIPKRVEAFWQVTVSWVLAFLVFHVLVPAGLEVRYTILVLPSWLLLAGYGVREVSRQASLRGFRWPGGKAFSVPLVCSLLIAGVFVTTALSVAPRKDTGFSVPARMIAERAVFAKKVILISSEGDGEGIFISELAQWDRPRPRHIVLRATHSLATSDWNQSSYALQYHSAAEMMQYIRSIPIGVLVVDRTTGFRPNLHQPILEKMLNDYAGEWKLDGLYPEGAPASRAIAVYELTGGPTIPQGPVRIDVSGTVHLKLLVKP